MRKGLKQINVRISAELFKKLKDKKIPITYYVRKLLEELTSEESKPRSKK